MILKHFNENLFGDLKKAKQCFQYAKDAEYNSLCCQSESVMYSPDEQAASGKNQKNTFVNLHYFYYRISDMN